MKRNDAGVRLSFDRAVIFISAAVFFRIFDAAVDAYVFGMGDFIDVRREDHYVA